MMKIQIKNDRYKRSDPLLNSLETQDNELTLTKACIKAWECNAHTCFYETQMDQNNKSTQEEKET